MGRLRDRHAGTHPLGARAGHAALFPRARGRPLSDVRTAALAPRPGRVRASAELDRDAVGVPFWDGIVWGLGAVGLGFAVSMVAAIVATFAAVLLSGTMPSTAPGHLLLGVITIVFYLTAGSIAWLRLRALGLTMFRRLDRADVKVIALGVAALVVVKGATAVQLILTHQANHVQSGFEHFGIVSRVPAVTAMATALTLAGLVAIGPFVEELLFRGLLFGALIRPLGTVGAALLSALLFAAAHGDLVLFPSLAALGLITALAFATSRNLTVAVVLHVANNSVATLLLVAESFARH